LGGKQAVRLDEGDRGVRRGRYRSFAVTRRMRLVLRPWTVRTRSMKSANASGRSRRACSDSTLVNGQRTDYLRNSRHEATRVARLLSTAAGFEVAVEPVIVDLAAELTIKISPDGVHVVAHTKAARWLNHLPTRLPPDVVAQIFDVARRDTTWRGDTRHD
jgi:hypothetical protein